MHGFAGTVINAPQPGRLTLALDGFHENHPFTVADTDVELCKPDQIPPPTVWCRGSLNGRLARAHFAPPSKQLTHGFHRWQRISCDLTALFFDLGLQCRCLLAGAWVIRALFPFFSGGHAEMDSPTTLINKQSPLMVMEGCPTNWYETMPASNESADCSTPAFALFSLACSAYIDCEMGAPSQWQCIPPLHSLSECDVADHSNQSASGPADARSVDAALPLMLDELEAFIASLRDENQNDFFPA
jgi:hypothetical protein